VAFRKSFIIRFGLTAFLFWTFLAVACAGDEGEPLPDKSSYNLFNPTPKQFMREMSADRPDKTDTPYTVDAGHFQVEMDFVNFTHDQYNAEHANVRLSAAEAAPINLKAGLFNNLDVQLGFVPYQWERIEDGNAGTTGRKSGFGDITPRLKLNLVGNDGGVFALALLPFVKLPTSRGQPGNNAMEGGLKVPYSFEIPGWDVGFQAEFNFNRDEFNGGYHPEFANSVSIGHRVIGKLSYAVEFFSSVSTERNSDWVGTFDTWFTYQVNGNLRLDAGVYVGVTRAADDWHPFVGMTWRH
jgi:hypothetical protein